MFTTDALSRLQTRATRRGLCDHGLYVDTATFAGGPRGEAHLTHEEAVLTRGPGYGVHTRLGATRGAAERAIDEMAAQVSS